MATPTFARGAEPLVLATAEAYPQNTYTQREFLEAFLEVGSGEGDGGLPQAADGSQQQGGITWPQASEAAQ